MPKSGFREQVDAVISLVRAKNIAEVHHVAYDLNLSPGYVMKLFESASLVADPPLYLKRQRMADGVTSTYLITESLRAELAGKTKAKAPP